VLSSTLKLAPRASKSLAVASQRARDSTASSPQPRSTSRSPHAKMQPLRALRTAVTPFILLLATAASALNIDCGGSDGDYASLGEICEKRQCTPGLTCNADAICVEQTMLTTDGESTIGTRSSHTCQPGLVCAFSGVCERRPGLDDAFSPFPNAVACKDGLECVDVGK
jgi:hypothetical protein